MSKQAPDYRTDHLACPLNAGKLALVVDLVSTMRKVANKEAKLQWERYHRGGWKSFETMAKKGWSRPWVNDGMISTSHAQMVMAQVAAQLKGYMGNVKNTYAALVSSSSLDDATRHQLHSINRQQAWFFRGQFTVEQVVPGGAKDNALRKEGSKDKPPKTPAKQSVVVPEEVRALARTLIRKARRLHRVPRFANFQPQIDQRGCYLQSPHTASSHDVWLLLSTRTGGERIALPIRGHAYFKSRQEQATYLHALAKAGNQQEQLFFAIAHATRGAKGQKLLKALKEPEIRNRHTTGLALASTVRLILSQDRKELSVAVASDMAPVFEHCAATYRPRMGALALDLGLTTLLGSDRGDLLGRHWLDTLARFDKLLTGIARHRARLGLKTASVRYRKIVSRLRGFLKTEINRIFNHLVKTHAPAQLVMELPGFYRNPRLSRRLNRIMSNFGTGLITSKLKELETRFGITTVFVNPAYSSKTCSACGYVDKRNRSTQSHFQCKFCNTRLHADVNAPRNLLARRSRQTDQSLDQKFEARLGKKQILVETTSRFNQRYTRPRGRPADPRFTNPYFSAWAAAQNERTRKDAGGEVIPGLGRPVKKAA